MIRGYDFSYQLYNNPTINKSPLCIIFSVKQSLFILLVLENNSMNKYYNFNFTYEDTSTKKFNLIFFPSCLCSLVTKPGVEPKSV